MQKQDCFVFIFFHLDSLAQTSDVAAVDCQTPFIPYSSLIKVVHVREPSAVYVQGIVGDVNVFILLEAEDLLRQQANDKRSSVHTFERCNTSVQA